jgi:hypothetical protein
VLPIAGQKFPLYLEDSMEFLRCYKIIISLLYDTWRNPDSKTPVCWYIKNNRGRDIYVSVVWLRLLVIGSTELNWLRGCRGVGMAKCALVRAVQMGGTWKLTPPTCLLGQKKKIQLPGNKVSNYRFCKSICLCVSVSQGTLMHTNALSKNSHLQHNVVTW